MDNSMNSDSSEKKMPNRALYWTAACVFTVFGGYYLWTQHRAHVLQFWPLALFLLCPLMHLFGGHGGHGNHKRDEGENKPGGDHHA